MRKIVKKELVTLEEFIIETQNQFPEATGDLSQLLRDLALAGKIIGQEINRTIIRDPKNPAGFKETPQERIDRLENFASKQLTFALRRSGIVNQIVTEESEKPLQVDKNGQYVVILDPLDGTFNIEINASIGTIFSIYRRVTERGSEPSEKDILQPGLQQIASGYIMYGSSVMLVFSTEGLGVNLFTLDESLGEFFLAIENIKIPKNGNIFSLNTSYYQGWNEAVKKYYAILRGEQGDGNISYRYIGSLVADVHRTLLEGGIFLFPASTYYPKGKLKLMYQCNPLAFLVEQAGGRASSSAKRILNMKPEALDQTISVMMGSVQNVLDAEKIIRD